MTDPIGTAQERELMEWLRCPRFYGTMNEEGRAALYAMAATMEKAADALESRIAEVGRLTDLLDRVIDLEASAEHLPEPVSSNLLTIIDEARAALSLQRRV